MPERHLKVMRGVNELAHIPINPDDEIEVTEEDGHVLVNIAVPVPTTLVIESEIGPGGVGGVSRETAEAPKKKTAAKK